MAQDNLIVLKCNDCSSKNHYSTRNKKKLSTVKIELKKHCPKCKKHTVHKESKIKK